MVLFPSNNFKWVRINKLLFIVAVSFASTVFAKHKLGQNLIIKGGTTNLSQIIHLAKNSQNLAQRIELNNLLGSYYESISDYNKALYYLTEANQLNANDVNERITTYNYIGYIYWHKSMYDSSLAYHNKALALAKAKQLSNSTIAFTFLMLGSDYYDLGDYIKTSEYYFESLKRYEKLNDTIGQILAHNRLSKLYYKLKDFKSAKNHVVSAQHLNQIIQYHRETAISFNSIGNIQIETGSLTSALYYFTKTLQNFARCGDIIGQSIACINLGDTYNNLFDVRGVDNTLLDSSYVYYNKSYSLNSFVDNKFGMIYGLWGMADINLKKGVVNDAIINYRKALQLSKLINAKSEEYNLYWKIYHVFEMQNNKDSSYQYLKKYVEVKNSLENDEQTKALLRQESKYEIEKRISEQAAEMEKEKLIEAEKNKWKNYVIIGVIILVLVLTYVVYSSIKRLKIIANKNEIINTINTELTVQKKEITDSINYARRIQDAILPSDHYFKECAIDCFIYYKAKDIVAGDFYWLEKKGDLVFIAVADCTGHGVPGAMVSVLCSNALNRTVLEFGITDPGKILDKTRDLILETFSKSDSDVKDGMDISLIAFNKKTYEINWAGANNPLWYTSNDELLEIKANKQAIGKTDMPLPFVTHKIALIPGDMIYLFSDGYADQFGGPKGKKFKYNSLKELLKANHQLSLDEQRKVLEHNFELWKGNLDQVDDVLIMGIKIS